MIFTLVKALSVISFAVEAYSSPFRAQRRTSISSIPNISFNNWMGLSSLSGFDNFYGSNNFYGSSNQQIIIIQEEEVCHSQNIEILQQQLAIIQEFSKRLILEQVCDVETQVIVLDQFQGGFSQFHHDVSRQSGRSIGYDSSISEMITEIINSDGSFNNNNFGFQGSDIGQHLIVPSGSNWNDATSPNNLNAIKQIVHHGNNVTSASRR